MISIIIPTLNEEKYLENTLRHLQDGLHDVDHEIIISDGRSTDRTVDIGTKHAHRIVHHIGTHRQTIAEARNLGAADATGEFLVFIDADVTIPEPKKFFERAIAEFANPKIVGITVSLAVPSSLATWGDRIMFTLVNLTFVLMNNILHHGGSSGEFQMVRATAFRAIGGYRKELVASEDNDLFWRLACIGRTRIVRSLRVFHTSRRAHAIGWPRLLWHWTTNGFSAKFFKRSTSKEWTPIR